MLETQNKSDTPNFEPLRVKQQVIICSSSPTLCLASYIETQVFHNPIELRQLVMVLSFSERLKVKLGWGGGNNFAVLSHICSGLADCQPIFVHGQILLHNNQGVGSNLN